MRSSSSVGKATRQLPVLVGANKGDSESESGLTFSASWWCADFVFVVSGAGEWRKIRRSGWSWVVKDVACSIILKRLGKETFVCVMSYNEDPDRCERFCMSDTVWWPHLEKQLCPQPWSKWSMPANRCTSISQTGSVLCTAPVDGCPNG